jgi:hypothetical protein
VLSVAGHLIALPGVFKVAWIACFERRHVLFQFRRRCTGRNHDREVEAINHF